MSTSDAIEVARMSEDRRAATEAVAEARGISLSHTLAVHAGVGRTPTRLRGRR